MRAVGAAWRSRNEAPPPPKSRGKQAPAKAPRAVKSKIPVAPPEISKPPAPPRRARKKVVDPQITIESGDVDPEW